MLTSVEVTPQVLETWARAADYPFDKSDTYPGHAAAVGFAEFADEDVLDYGCGGGADCRSWFLAGNRVVGVDVVRSNTEAARQRCYDAGLPLYGLGVRERGPWIRFQALAVSAPLPFIDAQFDVVSSVGVLHHIPDAPLVLAELGRVLRPGGVAVLMLYTEHLFDRLRSLVEGMTKANGFSTERAFGEFTDGTGAWARYYTEEDGRALLQDAGLVTERVTLYNENDFRVFRARKP